MLCKKHMHLLHIQWPLGFFKHLQLFQSVPPAWRLCAKLEGHQGWDLGLGHSPVESHLGQSTRCSSQGCQCCPGQPASGSPGTHSHLDRVQESWVTQHIRCSSRGVQEHGFSTRLSWPSGTYPQLQREPIMSQMESRRHKGAYTEKARAILRKKLKGHREVAPFLNEGSPSFLH